MSAPRLFGTDGIRGVVGRPPLDEGTVRRLGAVLAADLGARQPRPRLIGGGDPRDSTPLLCRWLAEGLAAGGVELTWLGTVPTPAVAFVTGSSDAVGGIAISASHNPYPDNGIKLIDGDGRKWTAAAERELEARLAAAGEVDPPRRDLTPSVADRAAVRRYLERLRRTLPVGRPLTGLGIAVDAGHGAASPYAGELFERLGAKVVVRHAEPDGSNINAGCGSTCPRVVAALTRESGSDLGVAFDGDADRVIVADETGAVHDGDAILYLWARSLARRGRLPTGRIVATSMSNLGLEKALAGHDIGVVRCGVGDRQVVREMRREGIVLGGEQSGHIIHLGLATQGDGLLTALALARLRLEDGRPLSAMLADFKRWPQILHNVPVDRKVPFDTLPRVEAARDAVLARLGGDGRLVLRYSGTEPLARIMIEGRDQGEIEALAGELAAVIGDELAGGEKP